MAKFGISGVWKGDDGSITHYGFHKASGNVYTRAEKITKADAIALLEVLSNSAVTWIWSYKRAKWIDGEIVQVVTSGGKKFLRSNADDTLTDNLAHLIDYDWAGLW